MNTKQLQSLKNVLDYIIWDDDNFIRHLFNDLEILKEYYDEQTKNEESVEEQREDWHSQANGKWERYGPVDDRGGQRQSEGGAQKD